MKLYSHMSLPTTALVKWPRTAFVAVVAVVVGACNMRYSVQYATSSCFGFLPRSLSFPKTLNQYFTNLKPSKVVISKVSPRRGERGVLLHKSVGCFVVSPAPVYIPPGLSQ